MATATKGKKVIRKRRERKNVEKGQVPVSYTHLTLPTILLV